MSLFDFLKGDAMSNDHILVLETLMKIIGRSTSMPNMQSMISALDAHGKKAGLDRGHRMAFFLGQILHESMYFRADREIWRNTSAQKRYDTRTDLGNTPVVDGDGYLYRGRGPIQLTGKYNYAQYTMWARREFGNDSPNFVENPDLVNTDPWEGLVAIWYWDKHNLNRFADANDIRRLTKAINGGYNGLSDRQRWTDRAAMVLLGYDTNVDGIKAFQRDAGLTVDGALGPNTRNAYHSKLTKVFL